MHHPSTNNETRDRPHSAPTRRDVRRDPEPNPLASEFIKFVQAKFIGTDGVPLWPAAPDGATKKDLAAIEIPAALRAMFDCLENDIDLPGGRPDSAMRLLKEAATDAKWPTREAKLPAEWAGGDRAKIFHFFEVACAVNIMLKAYFHSGGGGSHEWPPTLP
jgi:hypothetical protein